MTKKQLLLTKLAEECNEVAQRALKAQQFGTEEIQPGQELNNYQRLHLELNDLLAVVEMLNEETGFNFKVSKKMIQDKKTKINKFYQYSKKLKQVK